jgi:hypothetical protein
VLQKDTLFRVPAALYHKPSAWIGESRFQHRTRFEVYHRSTRRNRDYFERLRHLNGYRLVSEWCRAMRGWARTRPGKSPLLPLLCSAARKNWRAGHVIIPGGALNNRWLLGSPILFSTFSFAPVIFHILLRREDPTVVEVRSTLVISTVG